jgi:hypothetical protein
MEVLAPGEIDALYAVERERDGIPLDPTTWQQIRRAAGPVWRFGVTHSDRHVWTDGSTRKGGAVTGKD